MEMEKDKVELKQAQSLKTVINYLEGLMEGFKAGSIVVEREGEFVTLAPAPLVEVKVEARRKRDKEKFSLELSWTRQGDLDSPVKILTRPPQKAGTTAVKPEKSGASRKKETPPAKK